MTCYPAQCATHPEAISTWTICGDPISSADDDTTFLNRYITGDETRCFQYDRQLKRESATWQTLVSPPQKKPRKDRSKDKVKLELFFLNLNGIIQTEFISEGVTVNKIRYMDILSRFCDSIRSKRPELWHRKNWLLLSDNRSVTVQEELAWQQVAVLLHPPCSPDLPHAIFVSFLAWKYSYVGVDLIRP